MRVHLLVDAANAVGSRPDGWWRDRVGANTRLAGRVAELVGTEVMGPDGQVWTVGAATFVVEGAARAIDDVEGLDVVRADGSGDDAVVAEAGRLRAGMADSACEAVVTTTSDRGLRARLGGVVIVGSGWLRDLTG